MADEDAKLKLSAKKLWVATKPSVLVNMRRAGIHLRDAVKKKINRGNPTGASPSLPGEPPKKVSGRLFNSITTSEPFELEDEIVVEVGTNVIYARRLEFGFTGTDAAGRNVKQAARPYLRPTLQEEKGALGNIVSKGKK